MRPEEILDLLPAYPTEVMRDLMIIMSRAEAVEYVQRAIETDLIMPGPGAMFVPNDGKFYYD